MGLTVKLMGCNGLCRRCYENRIRSVDKGTSYDIEKILATLERETLKHPKGKRGHTVCIHGGEPLLMKIEDLERLLKRTCELYGYSSIQTNGTLITDKHIELFKKYKTSIGVSIDGDTWQLNEGRWNAGNLKSEKIQEMTDLVMENMKRCHMAKLSLSIIALLSKYNATKERLPEFTRFLYRTKDELGIISVRTNEAIIYEEKFKKAEELTQDELGYAYCRLADETFADPKLDWLPYRDVIDLMMGYNNATCVFGECDIWRTSSERPIDKDGNLGNCLKGGGAIDGIQVLAAEVYGGERYESLRQTPQELGGCKDCHYWHICRGHCPGEGIDDDWRNRTRNCEAWKALYVHTESKIKAMIPNIITVSELYPVRPTPELIQANIGVGGSTWAKNKRKNLDLIKEEAKTTQRTDMKHADGHGDKSHGDKPHGDSGHGDKPHGDSGMLQRNEHGDSHGDRAHGDHLDMEGR